VLLYVRRDYKRSCGNNSKTYSTSPLFSIIQFWGDTALHHATVKWRQFNGWQLIGATINYSER